MNDEIASFIVKFVTDGVDDVKKELKDIQKSVDSLGDTFEKAAKENGKGDNFFKSLLKWTGVVGGLTLAFKTLKETINGVFDTAESVIDLYGKEQTLRVDAKVLERWGIVARRNQGTQADAYSFFEDANKAVTRYSKGEALSDDEMKRNAYLGFGFQYKQYVEDEQQNFFLNRNAYINELRRVVQGSFGDKSTNTQTYLKSLVGQESFLRAMAADDAGWKKQMDWAERLRVWSKNPDDLKTAQEIKTTEIEWEQIKEEFKMKVMPILNSILQQLKPHMEKLLAWLDANGDRVADGIVKWIEEYTPKLVSALEKVWKVIEKLLNWLGKDNKKKDNKRRIQTDVGEIEIDREVADRYDYYMMKEKFPNVYNVLNPQYREQMEKVPVDVALKLYVNDVEKAYAKGPINRTPIEDLTGGEIAAVAVLGI